MNIQTIQTFQSFTPDMTYYYIKTGGAKVRYKLISMRILAALEADIRRVYGIITNYVLSQYQSVMNYVKISL